MSFLIAIERRSLYLISMTDFPDSLLEGYRNFRGGRFVRERERYERLAATGQKPTTMVIACCDSRAAPETIFNALPGEIFVMRNVANLVPPYTPEDNDTHHATSAALEFAVQSLKVTNIIVLGHGRCGGVAAALDPNLEPLSPGDFIGRWMDLLKPVATMVDGHKSACGTESHTVLERLSVCNSLTNLRSFPCVSILEKKQRLKLHGAWFDISTGELWLLDEDAKIDETKQLAHERFKLVE